MSAQGEVVNFEPITTNGLAVATVGSRTLLLACNPNDNSVSIVDTANNTALQRVPVGLTPVAVCWNSGNSRFYTANLIGDSVTAVEITAPGGALQVRVLATEQVFDEPMDVAIGPVDGRVYVAQGGRSALARLDATTLATLDVFFLTNPFLAANALTTPGLGLPTTAGSSALRVPRRLVMDGPRVHVLALKGDTGVDLENLAVGFKYDLLTWDTQTGATVQRGAFGSANEAIALGADGNFYVAGSLAQNQVQGNAALSNTTVGSPVETGFVRSDLWLVAANSPGTTVAAVRDLNRDAAGNAVPAAAAAAMPAGVALLQSGNNVNKVFVSSFGTDRILELVSAGPINTWVRTAIPVPAPATNAFGVGMNGPRDLEIVATAQGTRLYCLNELDCSISVFDPTVPGAAATQLARIQLANRLTPAQQVGRRFLYDARISGSGKVACASCHTDGRTDSLAWHLGDIAPIGTPGTDIPNVTDPVAGLVDFMIDGVTSPGLLNGSVPGSHAFPLDKGRMVTQTLQGLVDHPVTEETQYLFSGAPYHWRGDRATFDAFNEAFVNLMGAAPIGTGTGAQAMGLSAADMRLYRLYVESIMYPPNPEQPRDRLFSGSMGLDRTGVDGTGGRHGLEVFLARPHTAGSPGFAFAGRSCVHCHALPSGSNNRITITDGFGGAGEQPLESAQLRGLVQREGMLEIVPQPTFQAAGLPTPRLGESGLTHAGDDFGSGTPATINTFVSILFAPLFTLPAELGTMTDLITFLREVDWGVAPMIGRVATVTPSTVGTPAQIAQMEAQAMAANCDVVVHLRTGTALSGYYFDVIASTVAMPRYREEATGALVNGATLIGKGRNPDSSAIFQAVPAGSGRRVASINGNGTWATATGPAPSAVVLQPMRPATPWREVASVTQNWAANGAPGDFVWTGAVPTPIHPRAQRVFQSTLLAGASSFGVTSPMHHEPPRRFRVTGTNIRLGARLRLAFSSDPANPGPAATSFQVIDVPLFPSRDPVTGALVFETAAEMAALPTLGMLCGGTFAPDVGRVFLGAVPENVPNALAPATWNVFHVRVVNADGTTSPFGVWQSLTVQNN